MPTGLQHVYGVVGWQVYAMFVEGVRHPHAYSMYMEWLGGRYMLCS